MKKFKKHLFLGIICTNLSIACSVVAADDFETVRDQGFFSFIETFGAERAEELNLEDPIEKQMREEKDRRRSKEREELKAAGVVRKRVEEAEKKRVEEERLAEIEQLRQEAEKQAKEDMEREEIEQLMKDIDLKYVEFVDKRIAYQEEVKYLNVWYHKIMEPLLINGKYPPINQQIIALIPLEYTQRAECVNSGNFGNINNLGKTIKEMMVKYQLLTTIPHPHWNEFQGY